MKINWRFVKSVLGILILAFLVSFSSIRHACKPMKELLLSIDGSSGFRFVDHDMIMKIIDGKELNTGGTALGNMDILNIEQKINSNPFVKKSEVFQDVDGTMMVSVNQKKPVARIKNGNLEYYLSEELSEMPLSKNYSAEVLLVGGNIVKEDFEGIKGLSEVISDDKLLKSHIIGVKKEKPNSFILLVNKGGYVIEFGELENFDEKFENLKLFYDQYLGKVGLNYYDKISLKFKNQIVATKRNNDEK